MPNKRNEPMTGSAVSMALHSGAVDALLVTAHPGRWAPSQTIAAMKKKPKSSKVDYEDLAYTYQVVEVALLNSILKAPVSRTSVNAAKSATISYSIRD
jgi:hypothetical protein